MGFMKPDMPALPVAPTPSSPPPLFGMQSTPAAKKPGAKPSTPTMLGATMTPAAAQLGTKTLLGS